jgi:hypothetical protein
VQNDGLTNSQKCTILKTRKEKERFTKMTRREELTNRLDEVETKRFYLAMKDRWNNDDYDKERELANEELAIRKELAGLE